MHSSLILSESLRQTISKEMLCGVLGAVVRLGSRAAVFMRMPYGDAYAARGLAASLQRRQLCAASSDLDDQMKMLHDNPHYAKYGAKLERMRREAPDAFRAKVEEKTRKSETQKMAGDSYDERLTSSAPPPPAPAHLAPPMAKPKTLYDIMKVDLLRGLSADEISLVWTEHHTSRGRLCAAVPAAAYERMAALARECPAFVFALPRGDGYETFLAQFSGNDCHFTPLLGYKTHFADVELEGVADKQADILIGSIFVSGKTKWELLDNIVRRIFKDNQDSND
ncbi:PREDICTED: ATP synthase mitochondrial F1 complex assembly factor 1-like [Priapulus caudatus]|uniref:ATP synthase mitochondrial F1 complex assembly factor 1-like n=1 Tax=Priapulus caudatus TaxID=37621 RepID=A0ABM1E0F9_PRICU|nr:PREDICTED: ATP synthase mitochondrial F1 complex assembly factor 1-like [Priapulus caudatus]